ncbi:MAG: hypothetical protein JWQ02_211 [Capsulimonas sp.]|jgi:DNA-directed RNA polymerase subunit RPC12/RpoP|nr:hypothetical protein [Capsulimonas sp.]
MTDTQMGAAPDAPRRYPCPGCGADLVFDPKGGQLKCPYCGRTEEIPQSADAVNELSYEAYLVPRPDQMHALTANALEVQCSGCGSIVTFEPPDVAGECPFCGAKIVAQPRSADPLVAPSGVLPFQHTQRQATESIKQWLGSRWFAPNALKAQARQEAIQGVYLPFWTYDSHTTSHYTGERGEHYWETETYTETNSEGKSETKTRQVQKTRWWPASGVVARWFDDVTVPATASVSRPRLDSLEPWGLDQVRPYDPRFLSGYKAQRYQVSLPEGFEIAKGMMAGAIRSDVNSDIGGDEQRIHNIATSYSGITFKHLLMPVWLTAYRYHDKVYQVMVNARTGEVQGDRPYSFWKIFFTVLLGIAILLLIYAAAQGQSH